MATAYSVFANGGYSVQPYFIERINSSTGEELFKANPAIAMEKPEHAITATENISPLTPTPLPNTEETPLANDGLAETIEAPAIQYAERVMSPQLNFIINSLLRDVVKRGTGRRALSLGRSDLAGKTGTTNDQRDAWFNGFNPSLVAVAWVGFDSSKPLGNRETGGRAALPIWMAFMKEALKGTSNIALAQPDGIVGILIDPETGLKTNPSNPRGTLEYFRAENIPASAELNEDATNPTTEQQAIEELF
jgi:penicillin-binding protein 1A